MNKIKRSLAILLIIGLVITGMPINMASAAESKAIDGENTNITVVDDNQLDSNIATDDKQDEKTKEEDTKTTDEGTNAPESQDDSEDIQLNYIYVESPKVTTPGEQNIVVSFIDDADIEDASLMYQKDGGKIQIWENSEMSDNSFLFNKSFSSEDKGIYEILKISYKQDGEAREINLDEINGETVFGVDKDYIGEKKPDVILSDGTIVENTTIAEIEELNENYTIDVSEQNTDQISEIVKEEINNQIQYSSVKKQTNKKSNELVIVLDPGHDSKHAGATGVNGIREEVLTLQIAKSCKEELEKYNGVKVYLTREDSNCPFPDSKDNIDDIVKRVAYANSLGADAFVSIHLNSFNKEAYGAEVYYHSQNNSGKELAQKIQTELVNLGLHDRKVKANDAYAVINNSQRYGFPGIIIEHAYIDNVSDVNGFLSTTEDLTELGVADATGIANYFNLSKTKTPITGTVTRSAKQLANYYLKNSPIAYPSYYKNNDKEAKSLEQFCQIYIEEAAAENINVDVAFCQAMLETGWLQFRGAVTIDKYNFAGIGAVDSNPVEGAARFKSVREGIRAQIQHLKAYANKEQLVNECVDPRFDLVTRGIAPYVEDLSGRWATNMQYGTNIVSMMNNLKTSAKEVFSFSRDINEVVGGTYGFLIYPGGLSGTPKLSISDSDIADVRVVKKNDDGSYYCEIDGKKIGSATLTAQLGNEKITQTVIFKSHLSFSRTIDETVGDTYGFLVYTGGLSGTPTVTVEDSGIADVRVVKQNDDGSYYCEIVAKQVGSTILKAKLGDEEITQVVNIKSNLAVSREINEYLGKTYGFLITTGKLSGKPIVTVEDSEIADVRVVNQNEDGSYYCEVIPKKAGVTKLRVQLQGEEITQKIVFKNNLKFSKEINETASVYRRVKWNSNSHCGRFKNSRCKSSKSKC